VNGAASGELVLPTAQNFTHSLLMNGLPRAGDTGYPAFPPDTGAIDGEKEEYWEDLLSLNAPNVLTEMGIAKNLNPYTGVEAYDPDAILDEINTAVADFYSITSDLDPEQRLAAAVYAALEATEQDVTDETAIAEAVARHRARTEEGYQRTVAQVASSYLGGRAVMSGGFDAGMSLIGNQRETEIADYSAKLGMMSREQRIQLSVTWANQYMQFLQLELQTKQAAVTIAMQAGQFAIAAKTDQIVADLQFDEMEVKWTLNLFEYSSMVQSSFAGAGPIPKQSGILQRFIGSLGGNALASIGIGVAVGTAVGGVPGGVIGGVGAFALMTLSSLFK